MMSETERTAIVLLNWNGVHLFPRFLPSVLKYSAGGNITVYVADNGSTDGSVDFLRTNHPEVEIIELGVNHGFAKGYNEALRQVDARYYVLINTDVEVTEGWLDPCLSRMKAEPGLAALQPKILSYDRREYFEYAGAAGGYIDRWGFPFCRGRVLNETEPDTGQYDHSLSVFWATGACMIIRAEAFRDAGGFDDDFFAHMEEIDLCWRLKNLGWKIGVETKSRVYHLGGATLSYQSPRKVYLNFRNNLWMMIKNLPPYQVFPVVFFRMILDGMAAGYFLASGKWQAFKAVLQAHISVWKSLPRFLKKRKSLLPHVKVYQHPEIFSGSMVFRFYISGQKKFSDFRFFP